jgi:hypothetical protein
MVCIFDPAYELLPHGWRNYTCVLSPLYCIFSLTSSSLPPFPMYSLCRQCVIVGGGGCRGCWNVMWTIFYRSFTLCFWPDSEPTKLLHHPRQKWPVKATLRDWCLKSSFVDATNPRIIPQKSATVCTECKRKGGDVDWISLKKPIRQLSANLGSVPPSFSLFKSFFSLCSR